LQKNLFKEFEFSENFSIEHGKNQLTVQKKFKQKKKTKILAHTQKMPKILTKMLPKIPKMLFILRKTFGQTRSNSAKHVSSTSLESQQSVNWKTVFRKKPGTA